MKTCYSENMTVKELADLIGLPRSQVGADALQYSGISTGQSGCLALSYPHFSMSRQTTEMFVVKYGLGASELVKLRFESA
jgi:hypothetical protein